MTSNADQLLKTVERLEALQARRDAQNANAGNGNDALRDAGAAHDAGDAVAESEDDEDKLKKAEQISWERSMRSWAEQNGGLVPADDEGEFPPHWKLVRIPDVPGAARRPCQDTETLLNRLIEECGFLMHEVAFHSARLTPEVNARIRFLNMAESLAKTGSKIARTIAKLRTPAPAGAPREPIDCGRASPGAASGHTAEAG
ncbi:MAG: hypothetical protein KGL56_00655 [Alphaproteobacteria bacterium]|nr:hypothetical protein [Alphaproteobacteria bacterium]MDE2498671.1 hypothetical protein [Alphaproteobacteria bacterium]